MTVNAPPSVVFRWLCQLKLAPYSYDLIDNRGRRSPNHLVPGVDHLVVGERVLIFELASFARDEHLTLVVRSTPCSVTWPSATWSRRRRMMALASSPRSPSSRRGGVGGCRAAPGAPGGRSRDDAASAAEPEGVGGGHRAPVNCRLVASGERGVDELGHDAGEPSLGVEDVPRAGAACGRLVAGVDQLARLERQTAAADAASEPVAQPLEHTDLVIDARAPSR